MCEAKPFLPVTFSKSRCKVCMCVLLLLLSCFCCCLFLTMLLKTSRCWYLGILKSPLLPLTSALKSNTTMFLFFPSEQTLVRKGSGDQPRWSKASTQPRRASYGLFGIYKRHIHSFQQGREGALRRVEI